MENPFGIISSAPDYELGSRLNGGAAGNQGFGLVGGAWWAERLVLWDQAGEGLAFDETGLHDGWPIHLYDSFELVQPALLVSFHYQVTPAYAFECAQWLVGDGESVAMVLLPIDY